MTTQLSSELQALVNKLETVNIRFANVPFENTVTVLLWHLIPISLVVIVLMSVKKISENQRNKNVFLWLIISGAFIEMFYCGVLIFLQQCEPMRELMIILDQRYGNKNSVVATLACFDLFLIGPLSLIAARLFATSTGIAKEILLLIVSIMSGLCCLVIVYDEIFLNNFKDICGEERFCYKKLNIRNIMVFWVGFAGFYALHILICVYMSITSCKKILGLEMQLQQEELNAQKKDEKKNLTKKKNQ